MKIKLIKEKIEYKDIRVVNCYINGEYELGQEFIVYGIFFDRSSSGHIQMIYYRIYDRQRYYLLYFPYQLFEIVDGTIPDDWLLEEDANNDLQLSSALLHERYFFDHLSEGEPDSRNKFEKLKRRYEDAEFKRLVYNIFSGWRSFRCELSPELMCLKYLPKFIEYIGDEDMLYITIEDLLFECKVSDYISNKTKHRAEIEVICNKINDTFNKVYNM